MEIVKILGDLVPQIGTAKAADAFVEALLAAAVEDPQHFSACLGLLCSSGGSLPGGLWSFLWCSSPLEVHGDVASQNEDVQGCGSR